MGLFFAGVGLANLPYHLAIANKVKVLRDFFAVIFFVTLGMQITISDLDLVWKALIIFTLFVIIVNPLTTSLITSIFGYKRRTTFMAVVLLIPTSEFALIIITEGMQRGEIGTDVFALVVMMAVLTITYMSYLTKFDWQVYKIAKWPLKIFENFSREHVERVEIKDGKKKGKQVILCGIDRLGHKILEALRSMKENVLVVDLNPELIEKMAREKTSAIYGDINDPEVFHKIEPKNTKLIISTIPDKHDNLLLLEQTKPFRRSMIVWVAASHAQDALELYKHGADYVIVPKHLGGEHVAFLLKKYGNRFGGFKQTKREHLKELRKMINK
ncbi:NAD-binding protein [Patescibacteria group bacterium]